MKITGLLLLLSLVTFTSIAQNNAPLKENLELIIEDAQFAQLIGNYQEAIANYKEYLSYQDNAEVFLYLSQALYDTGNIHKALDNINKSIKLNSSNDLAYYTRANILVDLGNTYSAINDYTAAILLNPNDMYSYMQRAFAFSEIGFEQEAIRDFAIAIQISPTDAKAYFNMASVSLFYKENNKVCAMLPALAANDNRHAELVLRTFCI